MDRVSDERIPKIIHYCWFGGKPLPPDLQECVNSWEKLEGYTIKRWDESNCSFDENEFVRRTYAEKKLGFIGDYYRLKAVYEYGGIYLDTDVKVFRDFETLLGHNAFLNFIYDCSVGTAVIGAKPHNPFIGELLKMYDNTIFEPTTNGKRFQYVEDKLRVNGYETSNYYYTYYILKKYPQFLLNNKLQDMGDFVIYPKEMFEIGSLLNRHYTIHYCAGAWRIKADESASLKSKIKNLLSKNKKIFGVAQILIRKRRYYISNKAIPFYAYSVAQKKSLELPEL